MKPIVSGFYSWSAAIQLRRKGEESSTAPTSMEGKKQKKQNRRTLLQSHNYTCFLAIERLLLVDGARWLLSASTWMSSKKETRIGDSRSNGELRVGHIYFSAIEWILNAAKTIGMSANLFVKGLGWKSREQWPMQCHRFGQWPSTWGNENTRPPDRTTFSIPLSFCRFFSLWYYLSLSLLSIVFCFKSPASLSL